MKRLPRLGDSIYAERNGLTTYRKIAEVYIDSVQVRTVDGHKFEIKNLSYDRKQSVWLERGNVATLFANALRAVGLAVALLSLAFVMNAGAWDTSKNPDVAPSIGWGLHGGRLAGFSDDYSRYTEIGADFRMPVTNYLTVTADFAQTAVSNAPTGVSTGSNRMGASVRVYLRDILGD